VLIPIHVECASVQELLSRSHHLAQPSQCAYVYPDGLRCQAAPLAGRELCLYHDPEYSESLRGAHVVIFPTNDKLGRKHAEHVAKSLWGKAKSIKLIELPRGKDVWELIAKVLQWRPPDDGEQ
jgi:hypothetical protein